MPSGSNYSQTHSTMNDNPDRDNERDFQKSDWEGRNYQDREERREAYGE